MDLVALLNLGRREVKRAYGVSEPAFAQRRHERRPPQRRNREPTVSAAPVRTGSSRGH